jgi:hypothetical protein
MSSVYPVDRWHRDLRRVQGQLGRNFHWEIHHGARRRPDSCCGARVPRRDCSSQHPRPLQLPLRWAPLLRPGLSVLCQLRLPTTHQRIHGGKVAGPHKLEHRVLWAHPHPHCVPARVFAISHMKDRHDDAVFTMTCLRQLPSEHEYVVREITRADDALTGKKPKHPRMSPVGEGFSVNLSPIGRTFTW